MRVCGGRNSPQKLSGLSSASLLPRTLERLPVRAPTAAPCLVNWMLFVCDWESTSTWRPRITNREVVLFPILLVGYARGARSEKREAHSHKMPLKHAMAFSTSDHWHCSRRSLVGTGWQPAQTSPRGSPTLDAAGTPAFDGHADQRLTGHRGGKKAAGRSRGVRWDHWKRYFGFSIAGVGKLSWTQSRRRSLASL